MADTTELAKEPDRQGRQDNQADRRRKSEDLQNRRRLVLVNAILGYNRLGGGEQNRQVTVTNDLAVSGWANQGRHTVELMR